MIIRLIAGLTLAAAVPLPTADPNRELAPIIRVCAEDLNAISAGQASPLDALLADKRLSPEQVARVTEVCTTFDLGVAFAQRQRPAGTTAEQTDAEPSDDLPSSTEIA